MIDIDRLVSHQSHRQKWHAAFHWHKKRICFVVPPTSIHNIIGAVIRAWLQRLSIRASIRNAFARSLMTHIRPRQLQAILPPTLEAYRSWLSSKGSQFGITHEAHMLDDKHTYLLWLGERYSRKVVLFFHGEIDTVFFQLANTHERMIRRRLCDAVIDRAFGMDGLFQKESDRFRCGSQYMSS